MQTFTNPYLGLPEEALTKLQTNVSTLDFNKLKRVRLKNGTVVVTMNILFEKLIKEFERRGITELTDQDQLEEFVANCVIVAPNEVDMLTYNKIVQPLQEKKGKK